MAILGVESAVFGVDDLDLCSRFWEDFGLTALARTKTESVFEAASGSKMVLRLRSDPNLPRPYFEGCGIRETIWGVDTLEALSDRGARGPDAARLGA